MAGAGLWMINAEKVLDVWWQLAGVAGGGLLGVTVILWMTFSSMPAWPSALGAFQSPFAGFLTIVFGTLTILVTGLGLSYVIPAQRQRRANE